MQGYEYGGEVVKYFAYGSNMDIGRMKERKVSFSQRKLAILEGWRLEFNKEASQNPQEGFANIVPDEKDIVEGILYEIVDEDLRKLDKCEGYPKHYDRKPFSVICGGKAETAIAYIAQPNKVKNGLKPTAEYLEHLQKGSDLLSDGYREKIEKWETID